MEWAVIFQFIGVGVVIFSVCFTAAVMFVLAWYGAKSVWVTMKREGESEPLYAPTIPTRHPIADDSIKIDMNELRDMQNRYGKGI